MAFSALLASEATRNKPINHTNRCAIHDINLAKESSVSPSTTPTDVPSMIYFYQSHPQSAHRPRQYRCHLASSPSALAALWRFDLQTSLRLFDLQSSYSAPLASSNQIYQRHPLSAHRPHQQMCHPGTSSSKFPLPANQPRKQMCHLATNLSALAALWRFDLQASSPTL